MLFFHYTGGKSAICVSQSYAQINTYIKLVKAFISVIGSKLVDTTAGVLFYLFGF